MIKISQQQILERFDSLPDSLKEAGFSLVNTQIIQQTGEEYHLTQEKIGKISELVGYVLFGFIHAEDLAKEIRDALNIAPEIANSIVAEIDKKIFAPIRADLEKNYAPPVPESPAAAMSAEAPISPESVIDLKVKSGAKPSPAAVPVGMPTSPQVEPVAFESPISSSMPASAETVIPTPPPIAEPQAGAAGEPAPVIIHKETEFRPTAGEGTKRSLGGIFGFLTPRQGPSETKPVTARIEMIGGEKPKEEISVARAEPPKMRVVHYTDFRTPISSVETDEAPAKPPVSIPTSPPDIPVQPQPPREEFKKPESPKPPVSAPTPSVAEPIRPPEGLMRPVEPTPFQPVQPIDFAQGKPYELPKTPEPPKPAEFPRPEEKKPEKPFDTTQGKPGEEGDIIDLRTFEKI